MYSKASRSANDFCGPAERSCLFWLSSGACLSVQSNQMSFHPWHSKCAGTWRHQQPYIQCIVNGVQAVHGLSNQHFGTVVSGKCGNLISSGGKELFGVRLREAIARSGAPFVVSIGESGKRNARHALPVPKAPYKFHSLEMSVGPLGLGAKKHINAGGRSGPAGKSGRCGEPRWIFWCADTNGFAFSAFAWSRPPENSPAAPPRRTEHSWQSS